MTRDGDGGAGSRGAGDSGAGPSGAGDSRAGDSGVGVPAGAETSCGLLIRMWLEPGSSEQLRARVLTFEGSQEPSTWATAAGGAAVLAAVDRWIREHVPVGASPP